MKGLFDNAAQPEQPDAAPCPFCGAQSVNPESDTDVKPGDALHWLECPDCSACGPVCETAPRALTEWNERYALECTRFEVNRLAADLHRVQEQFSNFRIRVNSRYHDEHHGISRRTGQRSKTK